MAKRTGQRKRKAQRKKQHPVHPTQLGTAPPIQPFIVEGVNEWPLTIMSLLVVVNIVLWQDKIVLLFG